jgi:hypothetical protein
MRAWFWLLLLVIVGFAVRKKLHSSVIRPAAQDAVPPQPRTAESMVCCAVCQTYVPLSEAVQHEQHVYCCEAHAAQARAH